MAFRYKILDLTIAGSYMRTLYEDLFNTEKNIVGNLVANGGGSREKSRSCNNLKTKVKLQTQSHFQTDFPCTFDILALTH